MLVIHTNAVISNLSLFIYITFILYYIILYYIILYYIILYYIILYIILYYIFIFILFIYMPFPAIIQFFSLPLNVLVRTPGWESLL